MERPQPLPTAAGPPNGNSAQHTSGDLPLTSKPLTFRESLPYSPHITTLPPVPDLVPDATLGSGYPAPGLRDLFSSNELDHLNREAIAHGHLSKGGKQLVENILHEMKPPQRTKYKFRAVPGMASSPNATKNIHQELTPVTKVLYERVGDYFKSTKPNLPSSSLNGQVKIQPSEGPSPTQPSTSSLVKNQNSNSRAHPLNSSRIEVAIPARSTFDATEYADHLAPTPSEPWTNGPIEQMPLGPSHATPMSLAPGMLQSPEESKMPVFHIELSSSNINKDDYMEVAESLATPQNVSRRKERQDIQTNQTFVGESLDHRQRAQSALQELHRRMQGLGQATRAAFEMQPGFESLVTLTSEQEPTMTGEEQKKMHTAIQKVISLGVFSSVPVENLSQVLRLGEPSLKEALALDTQLDQEWDEAAVDSWIQQLSTVDTALKAARTSLRIICGGREDRQLYSESIIDQSVKVFQKTTDEIIIPLAEMRSSGPSSNIFKLLFKYKREVSLVFINAQKLINLVAELVAKVQLSELAINTIEFVASTLIFVDNAYYEKDSIMGVQKFDGIRSAAIDTLCQIFLVKPEQRQGILNEILTSLSKLPGSRQSSRQYKLSDGSSIQPVSALIMRLVQASSARPDKGKNQRRAALVQSMGPEEDDDLDELQTSPERKAPGASINSEEQGAQQPDIAIQELAALAQSPSEDAQRNASMVVNFLVQRAAGSSKTGDTPFRNILDHCVEDFTLCLEHIEWPSAELLLRCLMSSNVLLFEAEKTPAPVKNMALEILGNMSAAISRLRSQVKRTANSSESNNADELAQFLSDLANQALDKEARMELVLSWTGPYRVVLESLQASKSADSQQASAASFLLTTWAGRIRTCFDNLDEGDKSREKELGSLAYRLRMMVDDSTWLSSQFEFSSISAYHTKLGYAIILLGLPFCEAFERMLSILFRSMTSDQATVRSKSLKSISSVLETDPSILDGDSAVVDRILECARDSSIQVRESALGLMGNCIQMRPRLESVLTPHIMDRVSDAGVSVRRRAMKLARDVYLRNRDRKLRSDIASGLLRRITADLDEGVREAARQMVEEIWFAPFFQMEDTAVFQTTLAEHTALIIQTVKLGGVSELLDKVFQAILKAEKKGPVGPFEVCSKLVSNAFSFVNNPETEDEPSVPSGRDALQMLTIFAKAEPKLFTFEQIRLLKPLLASSNNKDEQITFRAVVVILKSVLPQLSTVHNDFIIELKTTLVPKMGKTENRAVLDEIAACVRVVLDLLHDMGPMVSLTKSVLIGLKKLQPPYKIQSMQDIKKLRYFSWLLAAVAQHFQLDEHIGVLKAIFKDFKGDSVARLMVDYLTPFTAGTQQSETRKAAIDGIASVCQAWPRNYTLPKVWTVFQQAFHDEDQPLENIILKSFKEFLITEERRSEASSSTANAKEKKSLTVMGGTNFDDVASATTQRFLKDITRICIATEDAHALLALEVLGSINRQGLTHPKETGVTLITLETSSNKRISELAFQEHRALHEKHESTIEREYTKAVQSAYEYQRDVVHNTRGATIDPPQSKLHNMMDVLKISKMKNRQRFFEKLAGLLDFDFTKLETHQAIPPHLDFTRFVVENIAFFEYQTVGELQTVVHKMEQLVTGTGVSIAQIVDSEIFNVRLDANTETQIQQQLHQQLIDGVVESQAAEVPISVDPGRLRQLATASIILLLIWETRSYLRRLYGMGTHRHDSKAKALAKDLNKTPSKTQGVHWDKYWEEMTSLPSGLESTMQMMQKCKAFVELMNVDKEFKVAEEEDDMDMGMEDPSTPSDDDGQEDRGRKRKGGNTPGGRKKRPRSSSQPRKRGRPKKSDPPAGSNSNADWF
ncbi:hypothetical protein V2G26_006503 [Clonostachys chloroleuca]